MHDEVSCEPVSSRLAAHRLSQQRNANETEIKSLRYQLEPDHDDQFEQQLSAHHTTRQQMASDIVANNSEAIDQETTSASSKRMNQHEVVKMEQKPPHLESQQQNEQVNGHCDEPQRAASVCAGCCGPIRDKFIFSVIDLLWHQDCVQCADCSLKLHERCFTFNGKLYCRHDYWHRFGPKCFACHEAINRSELVQRVKGNRVYHLKCFTCSQCNRLLERGEQLHLIDDKQLLCRQDFQQLGLLGSGRNHKHQQQQQKSIQSQRNNGSNKSGFQQQDGASNETSNNNNTSYFTLLSPNQMREPQDRALATKVKRGSLTSLDNMQDERLEAEAEDEAADEEVDDEDELMERDADEPQQDEVDDDGDDEVETSDVFGHADNMDLENEENCTAGAAGSQQLGLEVNLNNSNKPAAASANSNTANKRRRRRKRAANRHDKEPSTLVGANRANNKGQSILNGSGGQSASILANMQAGGVGQVSSGGSSLKCFSSSSTSSSSSTASNHSTSSGSHSQPTNNQLAAGGAGRGSNTTQHQPHHHHHHHHHHQSNPTQQSHHLGSHQPHNNNSNSNDHQSAGAGHKPTRVRTVLNEKQLQTLRDCYAMNPRPDALMKEQLVDMTGLSSRVIRVWFQNKRCKDKKKSILYKQMQQHEKDGRHLAGLTHIRGVPLVASSPIQYQEEQSSTQQPGDSPQQSVQSPTQMSAGGQQQQQDSPAVDIHTYQPPWKSLMDYAHQQQPASAAALKQQAVSTQPPDRLTTTSPRYQQLISQMHGYGHPANPIEPLPDHQVLEQQPAPPTQYSQPSLMLSHQPSAAAAAAAAGLAQNQHYAGAPAAPLMQPPLHLHAHLTQVNGPPQAPAASHHLQQFQH